MLILLVFVFFVIASYGDAPQLASISLTEEMYNALSSIFHGFEAIFHLTRKGNFFLLQAFHLVIVFLGPVYFFS